MWLRARASSGGSVSSSGTGSGPTSSGRLAERLAAEIEAMDLRQVRISWGDQHGILRGKTLTIAEFRSSLANGKDFQFVTSIFDTTNHPIVPPFGAGNFAGVPELTGLPDGVLVPDPTTFRTLPWVEHTGWILADAYFQSGREHPFSTRRRAPAPAGRAGGARATTTSPGWRSSSTCSGCSIRCSRPSIAATRRTPPTVNGLAHGFQYLTENRNDEIHDLLCVAAATHRASSGCRC